MVKCRKAAIIRVHKGYRNKNVELELQHRTLDTGRIFSFKNLRPSCILRYYRRTKQAKETVLTLDNPIVIHNSRVGD